MKLFLTKINVFVKSKDGKKWGKWQREVIIESKWKWEIIKCENEKGKWTNLMWMWNQEMETASGCIIGTKLGKQIWPKKECKIKI